MDSVEKTNSIPKLDQAANEEKRLRALRKLCNQYREKLQEQDPHNLARLAALSISSEKDGDIILCGNYYLDTHQIRWPKLSISDDSGKPVGLQNEALWLHYLNKADGHPLAGRWVNLSEIGGLFYQQAFQGYCGDELAEAWAGDIEGLRQICLAAGGWPVPNLGDLAFEWRALPRLPLCLCYRLPAGGKEAWATMLFDASTNHYVAADIAATVAKKLSDRLKPKG